MATPKASEPSDPQIPPPPRRITSSAKFAVRFGGVVSLLGWIFVAVGLLFTWLFVVPADWEGLRLSGHPTTMVEGQLVEVKATDWNQGRRGKRKPLYSYHFQLEVEPGAAIEGYSYGTKNDWKTGAKVALEVPEGMPEKAVIKGMRRAPHAAGAAAVGIIPLVAWLVVIVAFFRGGKDVRVMVTGVEAPGELLESKATAMKVQSRVVHKLKVSYSPPKGMAQEADFYSSEPERLREPGQCRVLYDPLRPQDAVLVGALPRGLQVNREGVIELGSSGYVTFLKMLVGGTSIAWLASIIAWIL